MTVQLAVLPEKRVTRVVVGTSVRKPLPVLQAYLASLAKQELPPGVELYPVFVADNLASDAADALREWVKVFGGEMLRGAPAALGDFNDANADTHQWTGSAMARVGANKDRILARARELRADYVWFVDADLICDTTTLGTLINANAAIVSAVYWTRWTKQGAETRTVHAAPQVWLKHPYALAGRGVTEAEFRERLAKRTLTKVPGYGACTLINARALGAGVSFAYVPDVPRDGMMAGEDRHFCIRAEMLHLDAIADPWPDVFHIYHLPDDIAHIPAMAARLNVAHPKFAQLGDLVNLTIQPIEPIPWQGGGFTAVPPQHLRGRIGALPLVPELEEAVYNTARGTDVTVPVHFPVHYPVPFYAGKRRLLRIAVNDVKPFGFAPVLEDEMLVGTRSKNFARTVDFNARQLDGMREVVNG